MSPIRPTIVAYEQQAATFFGGLVHVLVGLFFMAGGGWMIYYAVEHPPLNKMLLYGGGGAAVFGALLMPTIFPLVKQIFIFVVPYIPIVGGRRAADPPVPPPEIKP